MGACYLCGCYTLGSWCNSCKAHSAHPNSASIGPLMGAMHSLVQEGLLDVNTIRDTLDQHMGAIMEKEFKIGDTVRWTSQAVGTSKTKTGTVISVHDRASSIPIKLLEALIIVLKNENPQATVRCEMSACESWRSGPHYLVKVKNRTGWSLYHPLTKYLEKAD